MAFGKESMDLTARLARGDALRRAFRQQSCPAPMRIEEPPLDMLVGGSWAVCDGMRCLLVEERYHGAYHHGELALREALDIPSQIWQPYAGDERGRPFTMEKAAFLDIETTGLARGTGTYAFLVGVGLFEGEELVVRQYFMPAYEDEEALLDLLAEDLGQSEGLVTFNGRSFDWPILETRYVMARRRAPCPEAPHLDLLPLSRRLWRRSLPSCALSSLERSVLGVTRSVNDVPGYLIPQLYQEYLLQGQTGPMADVFYHNLMDVLSLVALAGRVGWIIGEPFAPRQQCICDYYALGILLESEGRTEEALRALQRAAEAPHPSQASAARKRLALLYKRLGRYEEAAALWQSMLGQADLLPYVELAKHYEHRLKDPERALHVALQGIAWLSSPLCPLGRQQVLSAKRELEQRVARLERRVGPGT